MDYKELNEKMIESFLETFKKLKMNLPPAEYVEAFRKVPRHLFTPYVFEENDGVIKKRMFNYRELQESQLKQVYIDAPIIVMIENDEVVATSSQPFVMAMMLVDAKVKEGGRVLEIGTGSGYNAAVLSEITGGAKNVFTTEIKKSVAELAKENLKRAGYGEVEVSASDGGGGYDPGAPYDSVIITCGAPEIPMHSQVKTGGTISLPLVTRGMETLCSLTKGEDGVFRGYLTIFVRFLHFEGIYSDKKQFAKNISSLQRVVESYGKKRNDVKELMADIFAGESDSDEIKKAKRTLRTCFQPISPYRMMMQYSIRALQREERAVMPCGTRKRSSQTVAFR